MAPSEPLEPQLDVPPWRLKGRGGSEVVRAFESPAPDMPITQALALSEALVSGEEAGNSEVRTQAAPFTAPPAPWACGAVVAVMNGLLTG